MALTLAAQDQSLDLLEVVDGDRTHEAVLAFGKQRPGADEAEELVVNFARGDQVYRADAVAQRARHRAQLHAPARRALFAHLVRDTADLDERHPRAVCAGQAPLAI